jgi:hypothetical protein
VPPASVTVLSGLAGDHCRVKMPRPVHPAGHPTGLAARYRLTRWGTAEHDLYDLDELAAILAPRAGD